MRNSESSDIPSSYPSHSRWYTTPVTRPEPTLPLQPAPEGAEPEGRRSTRRLFSRLFSRCSSQDSSSGSSSVRSLDDDSPSTGGESVDSDDGARMPNVNCDAGVSETTLSSFRNRRAELAPIKESGDGYHSVLSRSRGERTWRESGISSTNTSSGGGSSSSWLSSSLHGRCPPLLSRLRRHARDESTHTGLEEGYSRPRHLLRRWNDLDHKELQEDDDDEEEEDGDEEEEGAVGLEAFGAGHPCSLEDDSLPELEDVSVNFSARRRVAVYENISVSTGPLSGIESQRDVQKEKSISSQDQEKLRKIKER